MELPKPTISVLYKSLFANIIILGLSLLFALIENMIPLFIFGCIFGICLRIIIYQRNKQYFLLAADVIESPDEEKKMYDKIHSKKKISRPLIILLMVVYTLIILGFHGIFDFGYKDVIAVALLSTFCSYHASTFFLWKYLFTKEE